MKEAVGAAHVADPDSGKRAQPRRAFLRNDGAVQNTHALAEQVRSQPAVP